MIVGLLFILIALLPIVDTVYGAVTVKPVDTVIIPSNRTEIEPETCQAVLMDNSYECIEG